MHEDSNLETKQPTHDTTDSDGSLPRSIQILLHATAPGKKQIVRSVVYRFFPGSTFFPGAVPGTL